MSHISLAFPFLTLKRRAGSSRALAFIRGPSQTAAQLLALRRPPESASPCQPLWSGAVFLCRVALRPPAPEAVDAFATVRSRSAGRRAAPETLAPLATRDSAVCGRRSHLDRSPPSGHRTGMPVSDRLLGSRCAHPGIPTPRCPDVSTPDSPACLTPGQQQIQIVVGSQRPVPIEVAARPLGEARVIHGDEGGRISIGICHGTDVA